MKGQVDVPKLCMLFQVSTSSILGYGIVFSHQLASQFFLVLFLPTLGFDVNST